ncbi:MAG: hypothetical protein ACOZAO_04660 [Patescibacteria group bacterium]
MLIKAQIFRCDKRKGYALAKPEEKTHLNQFGHIFIPLQFALEHGEAIDNNDRVFLEPTPNTRRSEEAVRDPGDKGYCAKDRSVRRIRS